jgi:FkbM family methyltransferase
MENFYKTLYFDLTLFRVLPFSSWIKITISKYKCILLIILGLKNNKLKVGKQTLDVSTIGDVGTAISSLSDEYFDLYKVLKNEEIKTVVDVGANIGQFTNAIKFWYPEVAMHSFEPDLDTFEILQKNTKDLSGVKIYDFGLSEKEGEFNFHKAKTSGMSSLIKTSEDQDCIKVKVKKADDVLKGISTIDVFKIDVEGAELSVLQGSEEVLKKSKYLLIEMSFERQTNGVKNLDILSFVKKVCPNSEIFHTGRKLGGGGVVTAQDFLIKLNN